MSDSVAGYALTLLNIGISAAKVSEFVKGVFLEKVNPLEQELLDAAAQANGMIHILPGYYGPVVGIQKPGYQHIEPLGEDNPRVAADYREALAKLVAKGLTETPVQDDSAVFLSAAGWRAAKASPEQSPE